MEGEQPKLEVKKTTITSEAYKADVEVDRCNVMD